MTMGEIRASVTLENRDDRGAVYLGRRVEADVRRTTVEGIVDTGAVSLVIPVEIATELGLRHWGTRTVVYADERREERTPRQRERNRPVGSIPRRVGSNSISDSRAREVSAVTTNPRQQPGQARGRGLRLDGIGSPGLAPPVVQTAAMATSSTATRVCEKAWIATTYDPATAAGTASTSRRETPRQKKTSGVAASAAARGHRPSRTPRGPSRRRRGRTGRR